MKSEFWHERWQSGRIGFHQTQVNCFLQRYWSVLMAAGEGRVLVPLCGKSRDMLWLREQGHEVTGVELSDLACQAFMSELGVDTPARQEAGFAVREHEGLQLLCGDFFVLPEISYAEIRWVYDRAALIAFPADMRRAYAQSLIHNLPEGVAILLITLEFDDQQGPPFSVSEPEVRELYGERFEVEKLETEQSKGRGGRVETESVYVLRDK